MTKKLKKELEAAAYTMPGIIKEGKEVIDLLEVFEIIEKHWPVNYSPVNDPDVAPADAADIEYF